MSTQRPEITNEHLTFSGDIVKLGGAMSRVAVQRVVERFGDLRPSQAKICYGSVPTF